MRIKEFDYLKGVMIIFVISFHLVYFEQLYPYAKLVAYTFHMPVFLVISGYLMNINKKLKDFYLTVSGLAIPYIIMESGYIVMASLLPINEHIDHLTFGVFISKLLLHHTKEVTRFILTGLALYLYSHVLGILSFTLSVFFLMGIVLRQCNMNFMRFFQSSSFALLAFLLLIYHEQYLSPSTLGGILIFYLIISCCLFTFKYSPQLICSSIVYLGRNSLLLYAFSPIFTILCKQMVPWLAFDKTGVLFLIASLIVCISGSLCIGYLMDVLRISPLFFRKQNVIRK